jgi:hypothetical protein
MSLIPNAEVLSVTPVKSPPDRQANGFVVVLKCPYCCSEHSILLPQDKPGEYWRTMPCKPPDNAFNGPIDMTHTAVRFKVERHHSGGQVASHWG